MNPKQILNEDIENVEWSMKQLQKTKDIWASAVILMIAKAVRDLLLIQRKGIDALRLSESMSPEVETKNASFLKRMFSRLWRRR